MSFVANTYNRFNLKFEYGKGCWLFTKEDKKYLDLVAGIAVCALGHNHKKFNSSIKAQIDKIIHVSNLYHIDPQEILAEKLCEKSFAEKVFFCNSGTEANEAAIKLVRKFGFEQSSEKIKILSFVNSFHGRTTGSISITGQEKYRKGFGKLLDNVEFVEFNNEIDLESKMDKNVAGVFVEIIQGEGGINLIDKNFLQKLRDMCNKFNAVLVFDEVQTGMGRTGKLFAYEHFNIEPDLITVAKALGNGIPIGALLGKEKFMEILSPGTHAATFGGNYLSTMAGIAVLDIFEQENIVENTRKTGVYFIDKLKSLQNKYQVIKKVKGLGLMIGMEVNCKAIDIINKLINENILTVAAGENVVRFVPPLIISKEEIDFACEKIEAVLKETS